MVRETLRGLTVLVVEDDSMIGLLIEDVLIDEGCKIDGPHLSLNAGLAAAQSDMIDVAVLDVNLAGKMSYPIAEILASRNIPFVLTSGYGDAAPAEHPDWAVCGKPFTSETLTAAVKAVLASHSPAKAG